jgi:DUF1680 family protein
MRSTAPRRQAASAITASPPAKTRACLWTAPHAGRVFQDTDLTKWLEAVAGHLACARNPQLEAKADEMVDLIGQAQEPDGYLNTYGTLVLGNQRWRNLRDEHELYCSGHLIEGGRRYFRSHRQTDIARDRKTQGRLDRQNLRTWTRPEARLSRASGNRAGAGAPLPGNPERGLP